VPTPEIVADRLKWNAGRRCHVPNGQTDPGPQRSQCSGELVLRRDGAGIEFLVVGHGARPALNAMSIQGGLSMRAGGDIRCRLRDVGWREMA
jgi:hypothetical protein